MNKRVKILAAGLGVMGLLLLAGYLKQQDRNMDGSVNSLATIEATIGDKTFYTKRSAYEAYANEKESFYNRPAGVLEYDAGHAESLAQPSDEKPALSSDREVPRRSAEQFEAAYEQISQNVRTIDEGNVSEPSSQQPAAADDRVMTDADRRRRAMMRDWGMIPSQPADPAASGTSMFRAVIHGTQLVKSGQTALFRTKEAIRYGVLVVPANTLLSGVTSISENRLTVRISSVRIGRELFSLPLAVYGSDGIRGIPLNYDEVGQIADRQAASTAVQEASTAASQYGGTVGRIVGSMISGVGNQVRNAKTVEVKLIDNQTVILKIEEQ